MSYWKNWAKADADTNECHLLPYHGLDVAAVVRVLLEEPAWQRAVRVDSDFLVFWAAVHDVGKMSRRFQTKVPSAYRQLRDEEPPSPGRSNMWHVPAGLLAWYDVEKSFEALPAPGSALGSFGRAGICHHGEPEKISPNDTPPEWIDGRAAVEQFFRDAWELFSPQPPELSDREAKESSWSFAGLMVVADWLASGTKFRPWSDKWIGMENYWEERARPRARKMVSETGIPARPASGESTVSELFGFETPTPLQTAASEVQLGEGPSLSILEDATGSGKTEAALTIAGQLLASDDIETNGIYFALPTQATANQMHARLVDVKDRLFENPGAVYLAHGGRDLVDGYRAEIDSGLAPEETPWVADHQKLTLLAPLGVGTIDQAVSGILPLSHQSIRLEMRGVRQSACD